MCFRTRNRKGRRAAARKKQSSGLFFSPREIPVRVTPRPRALLQAVEHIRSFRTRNCCAGDRRPREIPVRVTPGHGLFCRPWNISAASVRGIAAQATAACGGNREPEQGQRPQSASGNPRRRMREPRLVTGRRAVDFVRTIKQKPPKSDVLKSDFGGFSFAFTLHTSVLPHFLFQVNDADKK